MKCFDWIVSARLHLRLSSRGGLVRLGLVVLLERVEKGGRTDV